MLTADHVTEHVEVLINVTIGTNMYKSLQRLPSGSSFGV